MPFNVQQLYCRLWNHYGPQGWWPISYTETSVQYHPGVYRIPQTALGTFEVCLGTLLTQNTTWTNANRALAQLAEQDLLSPQRLSTCTEQDIANCIRCSGYYQQKAKKIALFTAWWHNRPNSLTPPIRTELLELWGVGMETADSMLCYAYHQPVFVSDAYTKRLFLQTGLITDSQASYTQVQNIGQQVQPLAGQNTVMAYQEFHALIVQYMKDVKGKLTKISL